MKTTIKIQFLVTVLLAVATSTLFCISAQAQDFRVPGSQRAAVMGNGSSYNNGSRSNYSRPSGPSEAQIAQQQRAAAATALDNQGVAAYNNKDWAAAIADFERALQINPNEPVYLRNLGISQFNKGLDAFNQEGNYTAALKLFRQALGNVPATDRDYQKIVGYIAAAQENIADARSKQVQRQQEAEREQEQYQQDKIAANNMQHIVQNFAQNLTNSTVPSGGLDFNDGNSRPPSTVGNGSNRNGLDFMESTPNVVPPQIGDAPVDPAQAKKSPGSSPPGGEMVFMDSSASLRDAVNDPPTGNNVASGLFGTNVAKPNLTAAGPAIAPGPDTKAGDQLLSAAATARAKGDLTLNYDIGGAKKAGSLVYMGDAPVDLSGYSEVARKDTQVIMLVNQIGELKTKQDQIDTDYDQLVAKQNKATTSAEMESIKKEVIQKRQERQENLMNIFSKKESLEHRHRDIDTEVGPSPKSGTGK